MESKLKIVKKKSTLKHINYTKITELGAKHMNYEASTLTAKMMNLTAKESWDVWKENPTTMRNKYVPQIEKKRRPG